MSALNTTQFFGAARSRAAFNGQTNGRSQKDRGLGTGRSQVDQGIGTGVNPDANATSQFADYGEQQRNWRSLE